MENGKPIPSVFTFRSIGVLHSTYDATAGVPIQGVFDPESRGRAEIFEEYEPGLRDVEGFSHLILIYVFHRSKGYDLICRPYMEERLHGVFAMRAPRRPNPIGFSVVRLEKREGTVFSVDVTTDVDPVLDIDVENLADQAAGAALDAIDVKMRGSKLG